MKQHKKKADREAKVARSLVPSIVHLGNPNCDSRFNYTIAARLDESIFKQTKATRRDIDTRNRTKQENVSQSND